jgi:long-chain acyl-CoA synthetase
VNVAEDLARSSIAADVTALAFGDGECWTYGRLWSEAAAFAHFCAIRGVAAGDRVAIVAGSWPEHIAAWYGALAAGGVVVDVNLLLGDDEWAAILADCEPRVVVCDPAFASRLRSLVDHLELDAAVVEAPEPGCGFGFETGEVGGRGGVVPRESDDVAVIAYTSGTTGRAKGVVHTHGAVDRQLSLLDDLHRLRPGDFVYTAVPLFPLQGYLPQVASAVRGGAAVVLSGKFSAEEFAAASRRYPITYVTLSSPMLHRIAELPEADRPDLHALRTVTVGGAPLLPEVRRRFEDALGVHVTQGYGMTEMLGAYVADYDGAPYGSCGRQHPASPRVVTILADDGTELPAGEVGEIAVHRSCAMREYWNDPVRTAEAFDGDWYRTGDIGKVDSDGYFYVVDRKKDMIIRGGFNIYSAEIERVLDERPEVAEATVIGIPDQSLGEVPFAFVVPGVDAVPSSLAVDLREHVRRRLGPLKAPVRVELVAYDELPRNALGKVLKRELRDRVTVDSLS